MEPPRPPKDLKIASADASALFPNPDVDIIVDDRRWRAAVPFLENRVRRAITAAETTLCRACRPTILLTHDRAVKTLNARYRGKNKATNVLTFDAIEGLGDGDIALAYDTILREARAAGKKLSAHMLHLVVHGILHLAGHDHMLAGEARRMERAETRVLARLGVTNPWRVGGRFWS